MYFSPLYRLRYVDFAGRSRTMGSQTSVGWEKQAIFERNALISRVC